MHFTKTLFALLSIIPLLAQADPEPALQFKAVDLSRKRQTSGGTYVSSYGQCVQVCDGYFPQAAASKASIPASSAVSTMSVAQLTATSSTKITTRSSASTVTHTLTQTSMHVVTASTSSAAVVTQSVAQSKPVSSLKASTVVPVSVTQSKPVSTVKPTTVAPVSVTEIKISSAQATPSSTGGASPGGVTDVQKQEILTLHNNERAAYSASPLTWNTDLESYAKTYASKCIWKHSLGPYGENLAAALGYPMPSNGVDSWNAESSSYTPGSYSHWTQVVWKGTSEIGCALVTCANGLNNGTALIMPAGSQYLVCEYQKPGNVEGQFDANIGAKVA